jgi:chorismate dehydratase
MIRLGHIAYSNCYPVHARFLEETPPGIELVRGTPAELNRALATGEIDVGPCSSIEYARSGGRYRVLPGLTIASDGPVGSILLESAQPLERLHERDVFVPTASATSVALLRILLEERLGITARLHWFDQAVGAEPFETGAAAALWIGDVALDRAGRTGRAFHDLGLLWQQWTALPFAYALWQTRLGPERDDELRDLHGRLVDSYEWFRLHSRRLAAQRATTFGQTAEALLAYWQSLHYTLDARVERGLLRFFASAARLEEAGPVASLQTTPVAARPA